MRAVTYILRPGLCVVFGSFLHGLPVGIVKRDYLLLLQFGFRHSVSRVWFLCFACGDSFELYRPLLAWPLLHLLLAAASSGLCMRLNHLCHMRYEGLALCLAGGGTIVSRWLHYLYSRV